jgi:hypothetical protein
MWPVWLVCCTYFATRPTVLHLSTPLATLPPRRGVAMAARREGKLPVANRWRVATHANLTRAKECRCPSAQAVKEDSNRVPVGRNLSGKLALIMRLTRRWGGESQRWGLSRTGSQQKQNHQDKAGHYEASAAATTAHIGPVSRRKSRWSSPHVTHRVSVIATGKCVPQRQQ